MSDRGETGLGAGRDRGDRPFAGGRIDRKKDYMWMSLLRHMLPSTTSSAIPFRELFLPHPYCL